MDTLNNKRIAKNAIVLYLRMILVMLVSLYTSRIILNTLGVNDFGIYNIVGGVVILFSILTNSMSLSTQRFITFELGRKDFIQLKKVFSASLTVNLIIAGITLLFSETIGLWFVNTYLNIPTDRMHAANWVYQFTIIIFISSIIRVPYSATIIAYEKMSFYAYLSIVEVVLKLVVVFLLQAFATDKLILFGFLMCFVSIFMIILHIFYCNHNFKCTQYKFYYDKGLFKQLINFSSWNLYASVANIGKTQGINILFNIFYGVVVNAAMGITNQVQAAINGIVSSFQVAFNPQIVKLYAANEKENLMKLILNTSKYSYFLMLLISLPILFNMEFVLRIWLKTVPVYAVEFCQLTIIYLLLESISGPFWMTVQATGNIKWYSIVCESLVLLNVPIAYLLLKLKYEPYICLFAMIIMGFIVLIYRLKFMKILINFNVKTFLSNVFFKIIVVTLISITLPFFITYSLEINKWYGFIISFTSTLIFTSIIIFIFGTDKNEKKYALNYVCKMNKKIFLK